jgi:hypothetical protein
MKIKLGVPIRLGFLISMLILAVNIFSSGLYLFTSREQRQCGTIVEIQKQPHNGKHEIYYEEYFLVKFDSIGMKAIEVDMTTFMSHKKGDKICFMLDESQINSPDFDKHFLMFVFGFPSAIILLIVIVGYIFYIFEK